MSNRITITDLKRLAARLNQMTGAPAEPYTRDADGRLRANIGNFHISQAYGGYALHRMVNESGAVSVVLRSCHVPARELQTAILAWIEGYSAARDA